MALAIEDYGIIGDTHTVALVGRDGSVDWLCLPAFDSDACFAALLGDESNGRWKIAPVEPVTAVERRYRGDTLVLESYFNTSTGRVRITDLMPIREQAPTVIRVVEGLSGHVDMRMDLTLRFGFGQTIPWVRRVDSLIHAIAGPDGIALWTPVETKGVGLSTVAEFTVGLGEKVPFTLSWFPSNDLPGHPVAPDYAIEDTVHYWREWVSACSFEGDWRDAVTRSLITLKALTYAPTGGIVAAATTSLPETIGGERNWDYRYCWLRDATLTLGAFMRSGFHEEALAWRDWLLRAVAGDPTKLQIMYGAGGERRLAEWEADWLSGYEGSTPVRVGNAASCQFQLDVYGEVISTLYEAAMVGDPPTTASWSLQRMLLHFLDKSWLEPDEGIWEVRGPRRHFTHSKVMAWVAFDRAVRMAGKLRLEGPIERWKKTRTAVRREVLSEGFNKDKGAFTQYYGSDTLDASLLMIPLVGFLPATDKRMISTIEAIERELMPDGFVLRYDAERSVAIDGLHGREGAFLACSFWMADCLALAGRGRDARELFERLLELRNDLGMLSEEYDPVLGRLVGNFPQAFSHVSLVNSAFNLSGQTGGPGHLPGVLHRTPRGELRGQKHRHSASRFRL